MSGEPATAAVTRPRREPEASWWATGAWWLLSVVVALLHNGLWATPNLAFVSLIVNNPGRNPFSETLAGDYLLTDVSLTRLSWLLDQRDPHEVARLHLVVLLVAWAAVVALARLRLGHRPARTLTVLLAASPLVTVSMQWLGQPDPLTGLCGVAMVLVRRRSAVFAIGLLAGLTHPEQAVFMAGVAAVVRCFLPPGAGRDGDGDAAQPRIAGILGSLAAALGGVLTGWAAVQLWFAAAGITISNPRTAYLDYGVSRFWDHHTTEPAGMLWTLWGPLWLVIAAVVLGSLLALRRRDSTAPAFPPGAAQAAAVMAMFAALALLPVFVTLDETRVYAVLTAPLLAAAASWLVEASAPRVLRNGTVVLLLVTAVVPGGFATGTTSWRHQLDTAAMAAFLLDGSIDGATPAESGVTPWLLSPFDFEIPAPP